MDKQFRICDIFEKIQTEKIRRKAGDFPTEWSEEYCIPLLTAGIENQGLARFARPSDCPTIIRNCISVSANGANSGATFYQPSDFAVLQDAYAVQVIDHEIANEQEGLYLTAALNKAIKDNHDWVNKAGWNNIKEDIVELPVIESPDPDHEYTVDDIDWQYMQDRIAELEQDRIAELEQDRIAELDAYLKATGLEDYTLTEEDKEVLSLSSEAVSDEGDALETDRRDGKVKRTESFTYSEIFKLLSQSEKVSKLDFVSNGKTPAYSSDTNNNGCLGFVNKEPTFRITNDTPVYLIFGDHTKTMNIVHNDFCIMDNVKVLIPKVNMSDESLLYIIIAWKKAIPDLGYARHWSVAKTAIFELPVIDIMDPNHKYSVNDIDFNYMERYIRAIEKMTIADVVKYRDRELHAAKQAVC